MSDNPPLDKPSRFKAWMVLTILAWVAMILAYQYVQRIDIPFIEARRQLQTQIIEGTAERPYQARLLVPHLTHLLEQGLNILTGRDTFLWAYAFYDFTAIFLCLVALFYYLRIWFDNLASFFGIFIAAISMLVGFRDHYYQPWSLLEPAIISLGLLLIAKKKVVLLGLLILIGSINRETTILLVVAYFFSWAPVPKIWLAFDRTYYRQIINTLILLGIWAIIFGGLWWLYKDLPRTITAQEIFLCNLEPAALLLTLWQVLLFLGPFWAFIILGFSKSPPFVRRTTWIIPFYLLLYTIFNLWYEVRLLMSVYPVLIPIGLSYFFPDGQLKPSNDAAPDRGLRD